MKRVLVISFVLMFLFAACRRSGEEVRTPTSDAGGGVGLGSCVEHYSAGTLPRRDYAFDGVVSEIEDMNPSEGSAEAEATITFKVNHWYKGPGGESIALKSSVSPDAVSSVDFPSLKKGDRYLVSGDQDFIGVCGFTRVYTDADAKTWEQTFAQPSPYGY